MMSAQLPGVLLLLVPVQCNDKCLPITLLAAAGGLVRGLRRTTLHCTVLAACCGLLGALCCAAHRP